MKDGRKTGIPLHQQVRQALLETIGRGEFTAGAPFITERKLCEQFGVSTTTAVRVLNDLVAEGVLVRHRARGTFVAEPASAADSPNTSPEDRSDKTIACILQAHGRHETRLLDGVKDASTELGYRMLLSYSDGEPDREEAALRSAMQSGVRGIVLYPVDGSASLNMLAEVRRQQVPVVMVDRYRPDIPTDAVVADNLAVGYQVTEQLIQLGHERIATLWNETECTSVRDRLTGHIHALKDNGVPVRPELTVLRSYVPGSDSARDGTVETLLKMASPPTMLLCSNGYVLARVAEDLVAMGMSVPGTVDLAGMDDAGPFDILPLTAVAGVLPSRQMGYDAMQLLHTRIVSPEPYQDVQHKILPIEVRTRAGAPGHLRVVVD
ncbi:MAG TPA: GntR family transcriptional regulator [Mycobacteriales bacterium]|jgi:DNA-binding LacI/PurR family transcriptional regulator|nr:GntR family transcriptional regulator [Mycobacteriales bacterium]